MLRARGLARLLSLRNTSSRVPVKSWRGLNVASTSAEQSSQGLYNYVLYLPSALSAYLFYWQWQRMQWKQELIKDRDEMMESEPQEIPKDFNLLKQYQKVTITGEYVHEDTMFIGPRPRSIPDKGTVQCYFVVTPLYDSTRKMAVLVNRGFVTKDWFGDVERLQSSAPAGNVTVSGVVQPSEDPSALVPDNKPDREIFFWVDVPEMARHVGMSANTPLIQIITSYPEERPSILSPTPPETTSTTTPSSDVKKTGGSWFPGGEKDTPSPALQPSTPIASTSEMDKRLSSSRSFSSAASAALSSGASSRASPATPFPVPKSTNDIMSFTIMPNDHAVYAGTWAALCIGSALIAYRVTTRGVSKVILGRTTQRR